MKSLMRKEVSFDIRNNIHLYSMVDIQVIHFLLVFIIKYVYIKTPAPVISAHKFWDNQPNTSFTLFKIHESIEPVTPGRAANALSANLPNNCDKAFNLFFYSFPSPTTFSMITTGITWCSSSRRRSGWINPKRCRPYGSQRSSADHMGSRLYGIGGGCTPTSSTHWHRIALLGLGLSISPLVALINVELRS